MSYLDLKQDSLGNTYEPELPLLLPQVTINDLPVEILIGIFANLSPVEFKTLRLVCQKWNHALSDKAVWTKAFHNRFGTGATFASVTRSQLWLLEYFGRISATKKWAKDKATSQLYRLVNNEYGMVDHIETDFVHDRFLMFARVSGAVSYCTLSLGKNQVFIPDDPMFSRILAYDATWSYLCWGRTTGEIYLKNLATSTASGTNRLSITRIRSTNAAQEPELHIIIVKLNRELDKQHGKINIVSTNSMGLVQFWSLSGIEVASLDLDEPTFFLDTNFKKYVVVVTSELITVVDFQTQEVISNFEHGWTFLEAPIAVHVDFGDLNIVLCDDTRVRIFHFGTVFSLLEGQVPPEVNIIDGTMQMSSVNRNNIIVGGDGLLYAITLSDGSVCVFNIRDAPSQLKFTNRIMPFSDARSPAGIAPYTKVALNSSVVAIGALADWIHIYDAHSGEYLREGTKVARKFTRNGVTPILKIEFGPHGACGVVVCGDVVHYFRFGEEPKPKKKPNAPSASDATTRREMHRHIQTQIDDYDSLRHSQLELERRADKYNGTRFDSEQEEWRVALALSASAANEEGQDELERVIALLQTDVSNVQEEDSMDEDLRLALALSEAESFGRETSEIESPATEGTSSQLLRQNHGDAQSQQSGPGFQSPNGVSDTNEEILRRVLELLLIEH